MSRATVLLAEVDRPRGLRGEVVARLHADDPSRLDGVDEVIVHLPGGAIRESRLQGWKHKGDRVVLKLSGFETVDEARALVGAEIHVRRATGGGGPGAGRWFAEDLVGLEVVDRGGRRIGSVARVLAPGAQALLEVAGPGGLVLVPLVAAICVEIDPERGRIVIDPPEGLIELNAV